MIHTKVLDFVSMLFQCLAQFEYVRLTAAVGNRIDAYTSDMDFHGGSKLSKLAYPIKTIYSKEARVQLRKVLDDFRPDVCHLNNFNYQLTPSIILEIVKWRKETGHQCKIVFTAHDYQLVCPNHMLNNPNTHQNSASIMPMADFAVEPWMHLPFMQFTK